MVSRYVNGPVKHEGICILPPPPPPPSHHYRMVQAQPPRETFQIPNQNYVPQPSQAGGQGATLRGIGQTGPPNQAPTPPTQDLKVQAVPQQNPPMNLYQPQGAVRTNQYNYRTQGPPNQASRMANNQHRGQQPIYQSSPPTQYVQMPMQSNMYVNPVYYNTGQQRQSYVPQQVTLLQGQPFAAYPFTPSPLTQQPPVAYSYFSPMSRTGPPPHPASNQTNPNQNPIPPMPLTQPIAPQQPVSKLQKRRPNAVPIIDPTTGANKLDELFEQESSHPPSGESSARQTPQPAPHNPNKEVQATFAKQVAQVLNNDEPTSYDEDRHSSNVDHVEPAPVFHPPPQQAVHNNTKFDHLVQTSNLKAHAKEFVLSAKETPVVSANCDSEEVTLPNKSQKGRESPAKGKKRDTKDHHKETSIKEIPATKEVVQAEKAPAPLVKEEPVRSKETTAPVIATQQAMKLNEKETEKRKKENKSDNKPPSDSNVPEPSVHQEPEPPAHTNTKTKQNASQKKDTPKTNQKSGSSNVPPPQPAKSNSKTSKKNEINNKGASKEGTEMDVFDIADEVNANVPTTTNNSDLINANTETITNNVAAPVVNCNSNDAAQAIKIENNDTVTVRAVPELKPAQKKVDVTDVFGGKVPKPSPYVASTRSATRDETDRAAFANDRVGQNDIMAARAGTSTDVIDNKSDLPYKKGQWSPANPSGEKKYDRDFLLAVKNLPIINQLKPKNIPDNLEWTFENRQFYDFQRLSDNRYAGRSDFVNPPFMGYGGKNASMKGIQPLSKHPSLSGKMNNKGGPGKSSNGGNKISISLREEVKLRESENAWKPGRLAKDAQSDEERKTIELYKRVRGVLNKLTPQKFDTLLNQIKSLKVDTIERLQGVINLIFEKAVDEPNFSVAYAKMCKELSLQMQVSVNSDKKEDTVNFRKLLINRCQEEFEKQSKDETSINEKLKEIDICSDPEKKKDLDFELEEIHRRIRMRSVGNIRFIGELFKFGMLTTNIMVSCLNILLSNKDEESLECLCKLLTTVGKELEDTQHKDLSKFFGIMQDIVDKKTMKCSSRIRFMLQDVIDLRRNKWVPRRQDMNPKTIDQIQKEAENEHLNQAINSVPHTPRKEHRMESDMGKDKSRRSTVDDCGWTTARNPKNSTFSVSKDKLKTKEARPDEPLAPQFSMSWGKGSQIARPQQSMLPSTTNKFAVLDSGDCDRKMSGGRYKDIYCSKGSSLERVNYSKHSYENRGAGRSGSQHRMNDMPPSTSHQRVVPQSNLVRPVKPTPPPPPQMNSEEMERYFNNLIEEFISDNSTFDVCEEDLRNMLTESYMSKMVANGYLHVIAKFATARWKTGIFFSKMIKSGILPLDKYCAGVEDILSQVEDLILDIPTIWNFLAEILVPAICDEVLPLNALHKSCGVLISRDLADHLLVPIFQIIIKEKSPNFLIGLWQSSELQFTSFMNANKVESFLKKNQFEFLSGGEIVQGNSEWSYEQIEEKLLQFLNTNTSFDNICSWITANVGELVKEDMFIRSLAKAIYKYSIIHTERSKQLDVDKLRKCYKLFQKYVDNKPSYELQCLYALQSLIHQMEHPSGLLLAFFNQLSEKSIFSQESFISWENSKDPAEQEGKGVAMKQLTSFFTQLKENEDDEGSIGSEEA